MMTCKVGRTLAQAAFFGTLAIGSAVAQTPQQGTITGRVTDAATSQPVAAAQVSIVGSNVGTQASSDGQFTIRGVSAGTVEMRVLRVGYAEVKQSVTVTAGQTATVNVQMRAVVTTLAPVVTTATGEQRRVEVGNAIAQVDAAKVVETQAISNVADLLTSRAAGIMVIPGTQTGAGVRVRVRGTSSLSLTNNPIYVIDGVRVEGATGSSTVSVGGTTPSRVGDLNPEEIENIEIVRGPSASTLYGTDAANGVIVITTKRGVAGRTQWTYYTEQTALQDRNHYPTAFRAWRTGTTATTNSTVSNTVQCFLSQVAAGACTQDSVTSFNLVDDDDATPFGTGYRQQHGLQLRGGSETIRYFAHGEYEDEDGVTKVPKFEERYMAARGLSLLPNQKSPNHLTKGTARTNLNVTLSPTADLALNAGYISQDLRLPQSDDSGTNGIGANIFGGPGFKFNRNAAGDTLYGWREYTPRDTYQSETRQGIERLITSANMNWRPREWLAVRTNGGLDYINRTDTQLCRFDDCANIGDNRQGYKEDNRSNFYTYSFSTAATATHRLKESIESKTTAGLQYGRSCSTGMAHSDGSWLLGRSHSATQDCRRWKRRPPRAVRLVATSSRASPSATVCSSPAPSAPIATARSAPSSRRSSIRSSQFRGWSPTRRSSHAPTSSTSCGFAPPTAHRACSREPRTPSSSTRPRKAATRAKVPTSRASYSPRSATVTSSRSGRLRSSSGSMGRSGTAA